MSTDNINLTHHCSTSLVPALYIAMDSTHPVGQHTMSSTSKQNFLRHLKPSRPRLQYFPRPLANTIEPFTYETSPEGASPIVHAAESWSSSGRFCGALLDDSVVFFWTILWCSSGRFRGVIPDEGGRRTSPRSVYDSFLATFLRSVYDS